ncbi:hypothetical protein LRH25_10785 [Ideonella azotifigens]|uniref:Uncharacterized protein n=1 Tax=Ideonella azotifigens TaxID=513160 RepID=A0ABP3V2G4_9BURK|nr:choice-of-anchor tandem repeat GloVer-containing protein [Ideonella azotifigens]MCD2340831.1 hypothetical protein [Ideonella azotifigens]
MASRFISSRARGWQFAALALSASMLLGLPMQAAQAAGGAAKVAIATTPIPATMSQLYAFKLDDGQDGRTELVRGSDGAWYGVTIGGTGDYLHGAMFRLNDKGIVKMLAGFPGNETMGGQPGSTPVEGADGALYGTTQLGGANNYGTVYRFDKKTHEVKTLYSFSPLQPFAIVSYTFLTAGPDGWLYGTSANDGSSDNGMIFKLRTDGSGYQVLHNFTGGSDDGAHPLAPMMLSKDGWLYGTTRSGGDSNVGVIFRLNPADGGFQTVNHMHSGGEQDPALSSAALIEDAEGNLYGVSEYGGEFGDGAVFKRGTDGTITTLSSFIHHGVHPYGPTTRLARREDGVLFGTTRWGGHNKRGALYAIKPKNNTFQILHNFGEGGKQDGRFPWGGTTLAADGNLYGMTAGGGSKYSNGTLYKVTLTP